MVGQRREFDIMLVCVSRAPGGKILEPWPRPAQGSQAWNDLMQGLGAVQALTKEELAKEIAPVEPPVTSKKKTPVPA